MIVTLSLYPDNYFLNSHQTTSTSSWIHSQIGNPMRKGQLYTAWPSSIICNVIHCAYQHGTQPSAYTHFVWFDILSMLRDIARSIEKKA